MSMNATLNRNDKWAARGFRFLWKLTEWATKEICKKAGLMLLEDTPRTNLVREAVTDYKAARQHFRDAEADIYAGRKTADDFDDEIEAGKALIDSAGQKLTAARKMSRQKRQKMKHKDKVVAWGMKVAAKFLDWSAITTRRVAGPDLLEDSDEARNLREILAKYNAEWNALKNAQYGLYSGEKTRQEAIEVLDHASDALKDTGRQMTQLVRGLGAV